MSQQETRALRAYSLKLTLSNGRHIALPQNLLTPVQAASIVDDLKILARESGLEIVEVELCPINSDGRIRLSSRLDQFLPVNCLRNQHAAFKLLSNAVYARPVFQWTKLYRPHRKPMISSMESRFQATRVVNSAPVIQWKTAMSAEPNCSPSLMTETLSVLRAVSVRGNK
jgi:hypothetical protein